MPRPRLHLIRFHGGRPECQTALAGGAAWADWSLEQLDRCGSRGPLPWDAAFLAGQAFKIYRQTQGLKTSPMPDFYMGAHALVSGLQLLTRDAARYRSYFPKLALVAP